MPIKHAALKQIRKDRTRVERNRAVRSELKSLTKKLRALLSAQQLEEATQLLHTVAKRYDRAAAKGIIHGNTASRYKSRLMRLMNRRPAK